MTKRLPIGLVTSVQGQFVPTGSSFMNFVLVGLATLVALVLVDGGLSRKFEVFAAEELGVLGKKFVGVAIFIYLPDALCP